MTRRSVVVWGAALGLGVGAGVVGALEMPPAPRRPTPVPEGLGARPGSAPPTSSIATRQAYDAGETAYRRAQHGHPASASTAGSLAWGESRVQQSYLAMYEATLDRTYLDKFVEASESVLDARDKRTGQVDHRGRSGAAWSAAQPYTVARVDLDGSDGLPTLRLASTDAGPGTTVSVRQRAPDLFDLVVTDATRRGETVVGLALDPGHPRYVVPVLARRYPGVAGLTASDLRRGPGRSRLLMSRTSAPLVAQRYVFAVHTAMICTPFAQFAAVLARKPDLSARYGGPSAKLVQAAEEAVHVHESEWRQISPTAGLYAFEAGAPVLGDGTELPHNQYLAMARCQAQLLLATGDPGWGARARQMLNLFRSDLGTDSAPTWSYYWTGGRVYMGYEGGATGSVYSPRMPATRAAEDASHGALDVDALIAGFDVGLGVPAALLRRLTSTFLTRVVRQARDGTWTTRARFGSDEELRPDDLAATRWVGLARWDRRVYDTVSELLTQIRPSTSSPVVLPVIAELLRLA